MVALMECNGVTIEGISASSSFMNLTYACSGLAQGVQTWSRK